MLVAAISGLFLLVRLPQRGSTSETREKGQLENLLLLSLQPPGVFRQEAAIADMEYLQTLIDLVETGLEAYSPRHRTLGSNI